jgi:hypothetical protein
MTPLQESSLRKQYHNLGTDHFLESLEAEAVER